MDAKDEIKQRLAVEEVIGEYLELKRSGRNFKAMSPFTGEKTASFMVSPEKQIWHDFSSNQGGDIFTFIMLIEGVDFRQSLEILAPKAGVDLSQYGDGGKTAERKKKIFETLELAVRYYQKSLVKNQTALDYVVKKRGYGKQVISDFQMGYAPSNGKALLQFMAKHKLDEKDLKNAGLATSRYGKWSDMFRGRIMIPLHNGQGNPIGFTARVLDDSLPKYINTPQTLVYDKSRHVFGLHLAKEAIRKVGYVVLVEGNMDVIASHKAGIRNVVATAGTAMTMEHLKQLNRLSPDIRLAFDQDKAGLAATERAIPIAQEVGVRLSIIDIEGGKDPDELIKHNPKSWQSATESSQYVMDWLIKHYQLILDLDTAEGKKAFTDKTLKVLTTIGDPIERNHYVVEIAKLINIDKSSVQAKLNNMSKKPPKNKRRPKNKDLKANKNNHKESAYQDLLLGLNLRYPGVSESMKGLSEELFEGQDRRLIAKYVLKGVEKPIKKTPLDLQQIDNYVKIVLFKTEELYDDESSVDRLIEAVGLAHRLTQDYDKKRKRQLTLEIKKAEANNDNDKRDRLIKQLDSLIKNKE